MKTFSLSLGKRRNCVSLCLILLLSYNKHITYEILKADIEKLLVEEKCYLDPMITQDSLVCSLGSNKQVIIKVFKDLYNTGFKDHITGLRMQEAFVLMKDSLLTLEKIAERSGFGSSRTFYRLFIRQYNMTPSMYRKKILSI